MDEETVSVCFVPDSCDCFLFCESTPVVRPINEYVIFGHYLYGFLRDQGIARWNLKTGKCDFVRLPLFMLHYHEKRKRLSWYCFHDSMQYYWNRNYPDYLLIACPKSITSRYAFFKRARLRCYYYVLVDFAERDFSIIGFATPYDFDPWQDKINNYKELMEEVFGSASLEPEFISKINFYWRVPELLEDCSMCFWEDYLVGKQFWVHVYKRSKKGLIIKRMVFNFSTLSYHEEDVGELPNWSPTSAEFMEGIRLAYDRLFFLEPRQMNSLRHPLLMIDGELVNPNIPSWLKSKIWLYGFSYENEILYFFVNDRFEEFIFDNIYCIEIASIYDDPKNFICNLQPSSLLPPIKLKHAMHFYGFYILSSKYWLRLCSTNCSKNRFRESYDLGHIKQLKEPVNLVL